MSCRRRIGAPLRALHRVAMRECGVSRDVYRRLAGGKNEPRRIAAPRWVFRSATQAQLLDQRLVTLRILAVQVVEQAAAAVDHHQQATTAVVVLLVGLEVLGQLLDAGGQQGDLHFRRTGVVVAALVFVDHFLGIDGHGVWCLVMRGQQAPAMSTSPAPHGSPWSEMLLAEALRKARES